MKLSGKVALVTGAGRGIGYSIALRLMNEGAVVVFNDRIDALAVVKAVHPVSGASQPIFHQADVSDVGQVERMVQRVTQEYGKLDILINNAGVDPTAPFLHVDEETWRKTLDTNLKGTFFCSQRAAAHMCKRGWGRIVNISSVHSHATMPGYSVYAASKGAINSLTRELALELAQFGITVNAISPGAIAVEKFVQDPVYDPVALAKEIPTGRVGEPKDISGIVAFLCSDDADWLTGQIISVDGGSLTRLYLYAGRPIPSGAGPNSRND